MTRNKSKSSTPTSTDDAPKTKKSPLSGWKKDGDNITATHKETGHYFVATPHEGGSYSVTVCGSNEGPVIYSTTVEDDNALASLYES